MTDAQRTSIYGLVTAVLSVLFVHGVVTADELAAYAEAGAQALAALATFMAAVKTWRQRQRNAAENE